VNVRQRPTIEAHQLLRALGRSSRRSPDLSCDVYHDVDEPSAASALGLFREHMLGARRRARVADAKAETCRATDPAVAASAMRETEKRDDPIGLASRTAVWRQ
jgi:hypothetical protein